MMNNLVQAYQSSNELEKSATLSGYIKILINPLSEKTRGH
jgi:hypothetical protein